MGRIERADVHRKRAFRAVDHGAINRSEIEHAGQIRQLLALSRRLRIGEIAGQPLAIGRAERLDLQKFRGHGAVVRGERDGETGLREQDSHDYIAPDGKSFLIDALTRMSCTTKMVSMKNVTITVDEEVAQWARVWAAKHNTSVSRILGDILKEKMRQEEGYEAAMRQFLSRKPYVLKKTRRYPKREELHDRKGLR